jgi:twitching motility two-component system response regulator PilH
MATILVVDDVETDRLLMGKVVAETGNRAEYASDGDEAVVKAKAIKPALVLLDILMPKQDGFATCRTLKKDAVTAGIPVVMVTVKAAESDRFWAEQQGCQDYVTKPFTPERLKDVIRRLVA